MAFIAFSSLVATCTVPSRLAFSAIMAVSDCSALMASITFSALEVARAFMTFLVSSSAPETLS